jgi:hypothetical protein
MATDYYFTVREVKEHLVKISTDEFAQDGEMCRKMAMIVVENGWTNAIVSTESRIETPELMLRDN